MKKADSFQTSTGETVTISRAEYEDKNARLASQDKRISRLENQVLVLTEALRLARHKQFGASSEKSDESFVEQLSCSRSILCCRKGTGRVRYRCAAHKRHRKHEYALDTIWSPTGT